ncbi:PREDICTED: choline dehydrogenase, mitochondrial [Thamnophis sirtalis]|uniref:L-amino-acid oxidase n=1 Tax=Thamnophis sirtalis TaxID=35019 RepID=A0A6I9Y816_9SAUR|nr:PREDICTED: choline dehydrogenase, mitochondrial [Thamnophis sirtalis]
MSFLIRGAQKHGFICQAHKELLKRYILKSSKAFNGQKMRSSETSSPVNSKNMDSVNYIIVGAGSAGCVLANRLTEDPHNTVKLLEAGPKDTVLGSKQLLWKIHMPAALTYNLCDEKYNWYYHTTPQKHMDNRILYWPRGRVWGGSSSLNAMVYIRGHAEDYNRWSKEGAVGWDYEFCLPYFKKAQTHELGADLYRGGDGPLHVSRGKTKNPLHCAFLDAAQQAGYPFTDDMNGFQQEGFGWMDMTIYEGKRWNTASAYLRPALSRPNLSAEVSTFVTKILFEGTKAIGVEYIKNGEKKKVFASKEVILSGGAINSPQLLMLSGVGNADDLKKLGIPVVCHLSGVGHNLQDHLEVYIQQKCTQPLTLYKSQKPLRMIKIGLEWFWKSTGMKIDVWEFRQCVKLAREIFAQKAFEEFRGPEIQPGEHIQSDKEIDAFVRQKSDSAYHPSCTCKMGQNSDPTAVVDPETKVIGTENLRVVDASIMPSIVSGNLNAPTIMIAEKAADIILGLPPLQGKNVPVYKPKTLETQR